jgi:hypothetical protein
MNSQPTYVNPSDRPNGIYNNNQTYHKQSRFEVFNIGSDDTITVTEIAQTVIDRLSLKRDKVRNVFKNTIEGGRGWKGDVPDFWLDCSKRAMVARNIKKQRRSIHTCSEYINMNI